MCNGKQIYFLKNIFVVNLTWVTTSGRLYDTLIIKRFKIDGERKKT